MRSADRASGRANDLIYQPISIRKVQRLRVELGRQTARGTSVRRSATHGSLRIGSEEHARLFCRTFVETHDPFKPEDIAWPDLDEESLARLKALPVWDEAARTEAATAVKVQALGDTEPTRSRGSIALQGYEEGAPRRRHPPADAALRHPGRRRSAEPGSPKDPTWTFLRTGYGECLDSFFAFGLFALGQQLAVLPRKA